MIRCLSLLLYCIAVGANHFDGGTIRWQPVDPYDNSSSVRITIIQSYWWTYPNIKCANNVPITTSGRSTQSSNLTCVVDCTTDGGYSAAPVSTLTDCTSVSSALGMMTSQRSVNITLTAGAHFYLAYVGSSWVALGHPSTSGLQWSIVTLIDLQMRPDGFINTSPVANIVSPQYVIVNRTTQIQIPVSDANVGDDVRCRWSVYTNGYRRRRQINEDLYHRSAIVTQGKPISSEQNVPVVRKRSNSCSFLCVYLCESGCLCSCAGCAGTICSGLECNTSPSCPIGTTTVDTPGTLKSTSSYPIRQAINECGGICYPNSMPNATTLSNCTLSFTGLVPGTWYAAAIQIEDFINVGSSTPMSSVPVQFLIYVMPEPACSAIPVIIPLTICLEVTVGVPLTFNLSVLNLCDPTIVDMAAIFISKEIIGMQIGNMTISSTNTSLAYITINWTPQASQIGPQQMCAIAYTDAQVQSEEYCVLFTVTTSFQVCVTTTTTSTSTTTTSSSTTTTSVSTKTTSTSTTTTSTSATTTSSSTTSSSTTSTTTSSSATSTTSCTTSTPSAAVATVPVATTTTNDSGNGPSWGLIAGISSLALPLALVSCCCLYRLLWSPAAKQRRLAEEAEDEQRYSRFPSRTESTIQSTSDMNENFRIRKPSKSYQIYNILSKNDSTNSIGSFIESEPSILVSIYNNTNARRANSVRTPNNDQSFEMGNAWMQPQTHEEVIGGIRPERSATLKSYPMHNTVDFKGLNESLNANRQLLTDHVNSRSFSISPSHTDPGNYSQSPLKKIPQAGRAHSLGGNVFDFGELARKYMLGNEHETKISRV